MNLDNIKIVLVGTTHPGNIGAAARAMNNMCLPQLVLVEPKCPIGEIAYSRASGANTILDNRIVVDTLPEAIADSELVVAASARKRSLPWPELTPDEFADKVSQLGTEAKVSLVFGREQSGLTNEEIQMCNSMVIIPTNPDFSSLNLASAVQVLCYELYKRVSVTGESKSVEGDDLPASNYEFEGYFEHLRTTLEETGFLNLTSPGMTLARLRRLYLRAELSKAEVSMLRGILSSVKQPRIRKP
ncbi:MAG: tRNA (cytidine32/uridine32-2'-O)-methyltransferase [Planctomycetota bacterium]|jgi:tRNA (cytidine32/uridine32-2'-O)-methyltransferase